MKTTVPQHPFHLAFPVHDLDTTEAFYVGVLKCCKGRSAPRWIDFDFYGHQISAHLITKSEAQADTNMVDGDSIPTRHFGVVLPWLAWTALAKRLQAASTTFLIEPKIRFAGEVGEQGTFFISDPSGNVLEFKSFQNMEQLFAR